MLESKPSIQPQKDDLKKGIGLSLALHGIILSLFLIKFAFYSVPLIDFSQAINVTVGDFKDNNRLPEKIKKQVQENKLPPKITEPESKEEKQLEKPQPAKKEIVKPDTVNLTKARQKSALDKLKKTSALEKIRQDLKNDSISKLRGQLKKPNAVAKPRVIAAGTALEGLDKLQANDYLHELDQNIKQHWLLPQWLINKPLKAVALLKFNMQGQIISLKIVSSSGNNSYDQYCLQAIENATPFPAVPNILSEKFSVDGIVIGFPE